MDGTKEEGQCDSSASLRESMLLSTKTRMKKDSYGTLEANNDGKGRRISTSAAKTTLGQRVWK